MRITVTVLQMLVRLCFVVQLVLGILFWTGHGLTLLPLHMTVGIVFVAALWLTSILGAVARVPVGLVVVGLVWGGITIALGMTQMTLLPGSAHWVIQVAHLLLGMGAIGINERLSRIIQTSLQR